MLPIVSETYRYDQDSSMEEQLENLLTAYGLEDELPINEEGYVDLIGVVEALPEEIMHDTNEVRRVLADYIRAIPPKRRMLGLYVEAEHIMSLLMDRLEFVDGLSRSLVRVCTGRACPHYAVCPFKHIVSSIDKDDGIPCAVEREVIRTNVEAFIQPTDGRKPRIDPRRPEMGLMFKQLIQLLVKQVRISMYLQVNDIMVEHWEILKDGDMERFDSMNKIVHPLMDAWDKNQNAISKIMKDMGLNVEFQIKQGIWIDESSQIDSEARALEMAMAFLKDGIEDQVKQLPEGDPRRTEMLQAVAYAQKQLREQQNA